MTENLREAVSSVEASAIDGIATSEGFIATEINPRYCFGLDVIAAGIPGLSLFLVDLLLQEGVTLCVKVERLAQVVNENRNLHPFCTARMPSGRAITEDQSHQVRFDVGSCRVVDRPSNSHAQIRVRPRIYGSVASLTSRRMPRRGAEGLAPLVLGALAMVGFSSYEHEELSTRACTRR